MATAILRLEDDCLRILDANPKMLSTMQRELDDVVSQPIGALLPAWVATPTHVRDFETLARGTSDLPGLDFEVAHDLGGNFPRAYQVIAYGGDPGTVAIQLNDISARKREELRLRRRGEVQQELLDLLPHAVYWCDEHGRYVEGNKALCGLVGVDTFAQLAGHDAANLNPQLAEALRPSDLQAPRERELDYTGPDGSIQTLLCSQVALHDRNGASKGYVGLLHDISVRKLMERELEERKDTLEQAVHERTKQLAGQLALIAAQRETIHDLSTPIVQVWDGIIVLPLIGVVDRRRCVELTRELLEAIETLRSRCVIIDVTAIDDTNTDFIAHLVRIAKSTQLLGCRCVVSGLQPQMARVLATMQAEFEGLVTLRNLKSALHECIAHIEGSDYAHH